MMQFTEQVGQTMHLPSLPAPLLNEFDVATAAGIAPAKGGIVFDMGA